MGIEYFKQAGVYHKVPMSDAKAGGHKVLGVRWVDMKKADGTQVTTRGHGS